MLDIIRYTEEYKCKWNDLVNISRNGTFLFIRDYMDYHSDRYSDCSYLFLKKGKVEALIPGNVFNNIYISHQGLTYGGMVTSVKILTTDMIKMFTLLDDELRNAGIQEVIYKPVPLMYHHIPAQEDIYTLFLRKAEKIGCHISSVIFQKDILDFAESRKCGIRKSQRNKVQIFESSDFPTFYEILKKNLNDKYNIEPVHSLLEIKLLRRLFPTNIKLYIAEHQGVIIAGTILYIMHNVVHVQYISATEFGKQIGALDLLFYKLINEDYQHIPVFDFGYSTENLGNYLNENLIFQKEGFGGRGIVYELYKYSIEQ